MQTKKGKKGWEIKISQREIDQALATVRAGLVEKGKTMYEKELEAGTVTKEDIKKQAEKFVNRLDEEIFRARRKELKDGRYNLVTDNYELVENLIPNKK
ncbi:MAG: hypothetical protein ABH919_03575 [bacterium]